MSTNLAHSGSNVGKLAQATTYNAHTLLYCNCYGHKIERTMKTDMFSFMVDFRYILILLYNMSESVLRHLITFRK